MSTQIPTKIIEAIQESGMEFTYTSSGEVDGVTYLEMRRGTDKLYIKASGTLLRFGFHAYMNGVEIEEGNDITKLIEALTPQEDAGNTDTSPAATPEEMRIYFLQKQIDKLTLKRDTYIAEGVDSGAATFSGIRRILDVSRTTVRKWAGK